MTVIILSSAMIAALIIGAVACGEPEPDPQEVVEAYIEANITGLIETAARYLADENDALGAIPTADLAEHIGVGLGWTVAGIAREGGNVRVTNIANASFMVETDTTPSVKITVSAAVPFVFEVDGATVSRVDVTTDEIDLDVDTSIAFGR